MSLYETSDEQRVRLYQVAAKMAAAGLPASFISYAVELGSVSEGGYELMVLWEQLEKDRAEREHVIAALPEAIEENDEKPRRVVERPKLDYKDLDDVAKRVLAFKAELRRKVDRWGGISRLAEATGMPQPSL